MQAVILAGGKGTRLSPYTSVFPKPMLPVGGQPIIETIIRQLSRYGFKDIIISLGYLGGLLELFFKDASKVPAGTTIRYCSEETPLGTAGAIGLIDDLDENFLVINGDILTTLNYKDFFEYHCLKKSSLTVAVGVKEVKMNLGILSLDKQNQITGIEEKPVYRFNDNMGIYIYNRKAVTYIKKNVRLDLNILVEEMLKNKEKIFGYCSNAPYYWIDIGQHADFEKANAIFQEKKNEFLGTETSTKEIKP